MHKSGHEQLERLRQFHSLGHKADMSCKVLYTVLGKTKGKIFLNLNLERLHLFQNFTHCARGTTNVLKIRRSKGQSFSHQVDLSCKMLYTGLAETTVNETFCAQS